MYVHETDDSYDTDDTDETDAYGNDVTGDTEDIHNFVDSDNTVINCDDPRKPVYIDNRDTIYG